MTVSTWCQDVHKYLYSEISKKYSLEKKKGQSTDAQTASRIQEFELVIHFLTENGLVEWGDVDRSRLLTLPSGSSGRPYFSHHLCNLTLEMTVKLWDLSHL